MKPYYHCKRSVKKWGGKVDDYICIHSWFDESKAHYCDKRHRALRHHSQGIFECEKAFGYTITNSEGKVIPVREIGEQHVFDDLGFVPTVADWLRSIKPEPWMLNKNE